MEVVGIDVVSWETSLARTSDAEVAHWSQRCFFGLADGTWHIGRASSGFNRILVANSARFMVRSWQRDDANGACHVSAHRAVYGMEGGARSAEERAGVSPNFGRDLAEFRRFSDGHRMLA